MVKIIIDGKLICLSADQIIPLLQSQMPAWLIEPGAARSAIKMLVPFMIARLRSDCQRAGIPGPDIKSAAYRADSLKYTLDFMFRVGLQVAESATWIADGIQTNDAYVITGLHAASARMVESPEPERLAIAASSAAGE